MNKPYSLMNNLLPMSPRNAEEEHRAATPLELLFDLVSVIAIASAAAGLHHAIAEAHYADGIVKFVASFFAIWWAWMNYTWFASAYDNDDALYRILTMIIMAGALTMAAGISLFFQSTDISLIVIGFVIMRFAMAALWLRAAKHDPERRSTALWYAFGILLVQVYWVALVIWQPLTGSFFYPLFALGAVLELCVPTLAERKGISPWHRHHIIERYGLLNIIVLGETLLAGSLALQKAAGEHFDMALVHIALSSLVILFSMWWLYFSKEDHLKEKTFSSAFIWGYGHFIIYMAGAAVGAGFAILVDIVTHHSKVSLLVGDYAVAVPVSLYLLGLWFVRDRLVLQNVARFVLPIFALVVLISPPLLGLEGIALIMILCVYIRNLFVCKHANTQ